MEQLNILLNAHSHDPKDPIKIFDLAREYDRLEQGAMAVSLYLKAADLTEDRLLQYQCVLGIALCYNRQGNRRYTVEGALYDAITLMPDRPEGYYHISQFYADGQAWKQSLYFATQGLRALNVSRGELAFEFDKLEINDLPDDLYEELLVQQAISKWYITGQQDAKHMLFDLKFRYNLSEKAYNKVNFKLNQIFYPDTIPYKYEDIYRFKHNFDGLNRIHKNYSKHFQDLFVLAVHRGKRNGSYLEIGSGDPFIHSNTALLEKEFGWKGISMDISSSLCYKFKENRHNTVICADAREVPFADLLDKHCMDQKIDYLQIDCDEASIDVIKNIPFDQYKFGVVTLEHDAYRLGTDLRDEMRALLKSHGYELFVNDVAFTETCSYEDWYIHPDVVQPNSEMRSRKNINFVWDYFMDNDGEIL